MNNYISAVDAIFASGLVSALVAGLFSFYSAIRLKRLEAHLISKVKYDAKKRLERQTFYQEIATLVNRTKRDIQKLRPSPNDIAENCLLVTSLEGDIDQISAKLNNYVLLFYEDLVYEDIHSYRKKLVRAKNTFRDYAKYGGEVDSIKIARNRADISELNREIREQSSSILGQLVKLTQHSSEKAPPLY